MKQYTKGVEDAQRLIDLKETQNPQGDPGNNRKGGKPMPDPKKEKHINPDMPAPGEVEDVDDAFLEEDEDIFNPDRHNEDDPREDR
jgi:hypothetical protein